MRIQQRDTKIMRGLGFLSYDGEAERAGTAQTGKEKSKGGLINIFRYLKGRCREHRARLLSVTSSTRTRDSGHKVEHKWFSLNTRSISVQCG